MTPNSTPGRLLELVCVDDHGSAGTGEHRRPAPTPRDDEEARVPHINHPPALSSQNSKTQPRISKNPEDQKHRRQAIATLLEHYRDVLEGIPDREHSRSDDLLALMCPAWNHPSYQQLEKRLAELKAAYPRLHAKIETRFLRYTERQIAECPACRTTFPWHPEDATEIGRNHHRDTVMGKKMHCRNGGQLVKLRTRIVRVLPRNHDPKGVDLAIAWLESRWVGSASLPRSVFKIESRRRLNAA